jgi:hypothetical protein
VVILDSTKSADGQDVTAICTANPSVPGSFVNLLSVPAGNSRFRGLGVRPGDILKYYVLEDETVDEDSRQIGFSRRVAMELNVAQVVDDNTLLIEGGLSGEVTEPQRIEIWRFVDDRLREINRQLNLYRERRLPPLGWEPSPDQRLLTQIVVWLNQWLRQSESISEWKVDPLLETLSDELKSDEQFAPFISKDALRELAFEPHEGRLLQEAVWMRDISRWARGDSFDNVQRAAALFDWTARNVQLVADEEARVHRPWQVLLYGRGTAEQRAWVFANLCRQLGLDVVMLAVQGENEQGDAGAVQGGHNYFWLPALVEGDGLYLFDMRLGLPIPGPNGAGIATLKQVQEDNGLLRQLDIDGAKYPVTAAAAKKASARIVADPFQLSRRFRQVEQALTGDDRLALSVEASAVAERLKAMPQIAEVQLWELPFRTLREQLKLPNTRRAPARREEVFAFEPFATRPLLWKARTRHFQGRRQGDKDRLEAEPEEIIDDHREAAQLYTSKEVRPTDAEIARGGSDRRVDTAAKLHATYWVGLLSYDDGKFDVAAHWLGRPELQADDSPLADGARYNLARTYEAQGKLNEAMELLQGDTSPQKHGNQIRAKQLKLRAAANETSADR